MKSSEATRLLEKHGFTLKSGRGKGGHRIYGKDGHEDVILPFHGSRELSKGLEVYIRKVLLD